MIYENGAVLAFIRKRSCNFCSESYVCRNESPFGIVIVLIDESSLSCVNAHLICLGRHDFPARNALILQPSNARCVCKALKSGALTWMEREKVLSLVGI